MMEVNFSKYEVGDWISVWARAYGEGSLVEFSEAVSEHLLSSSPAKWTWLIPPAMDKERTGETCYYARAWYTKEAGTPAELKMVNTEEQVVWGF